MIPSKRYIDTGSGPSHKELWKKITAARKLLKEKNWMAVDHFKLTENFAELGEKFDVDAYSEDGQVDLLMTALNEVTAGDYVPPLKTSTAPQTSGMKLWIFRWESKRDCFGKSVMYLKFCIDGTGEEGPLYIHSLHLDHPPQKG